MLNNYIRQRSTLLGIREMQNKMTPYFKTIQLQRLGSWMVPMLERVWVELVLSCM